MLPAMDFAPRFRDLATMRRSGLAAHAARPFLGTRGEAGMTWLTHGDFDARVLAVARGFARLGLKKGDKLGLISKNRVAWAECAYAAWELGVVLVPMYEQQLAKDWLYILRDSGAVACVTATRAIAQVLESSRAELPALMHVVPFEGGAYEDLVRGAADVTCERASLAADDEAVFIYTSGTTGNPKGVRLSHGTLTANLCAVESVYQARPDERFMCILPWAHAGGLGELNMLVLSGASAGICDSPEKVAATLADTQPTWLIAVPRVWAKFRDTLNKAMAERPAIVRRLYTRAMDAGTRRRKRQPISFKDKVALAFAERVLYPKVRQRLGGRIHTTTVGAAALGEDLGHFLENLGIRVLEVYGQTESSPIATVVRPNDQDALGSVGRALPGLRIELDHDVAGGDDVNGEIIVHGHCVMLGYHGLPEEDARALTKERGLRTGDLGRIDPNGYLWITGRVKEVYKLDNGKFVAPVPIEERICASPFISQAVVHGLNRPHNVALVVVDAGVLAPWCKERGIATADKDAMIADAAVRALVTAEIARLTSELKGYERIADFVLTHEELTLENGMLTPTMKVKRREVLGKYGERLEALYRS
jgi:long-chain acyl-CoA synthetase